MLCSGWCCESEAEALTDKAIVDAALTGVACADKGLLLQLADEELRDPTRSYDLER